MENMKNTRNPWLLSPSIHRRNGGAVVSIVSASLVAGEAGEGCLRQREIKARRLAPDPSACHHCKACIPILSFNIFLESCMAGE